LEPDGISVAQSPGQEVIDAVDGMVSYMGQHTAQPGFGIDAVELGVSDQRVDGGSALAAAVGSGKQVIAAADRDAAKFEAAST
jgi:hypothetical protein